MDIRAPEADLGHMLWTALILSKRDLVSETLGNQIGDAYSIQDLTFVMYICRNLCGANPTRLSIIALAIATRVLVFLTILATCSLNVSFSSSQTPKYLAWGSGVKGVPCKTNLLGFC